jgi:inner membrane protein
MPTIVSHTAIPIAAALGLGRHTVHGRLLAVGVLASMAPDLDVIAFKFGIAYTDAFGHRGATHSLTFAFVLAMAAMAASSWLRASRRTTFAFVFLAAASHPILDMFTNGGLGVALLWPFSDHRFFALWRVIEVSPIGVHRILSERGLTVMLSELRWVWLPAMLAGAACYAMRHVSHAYFVRSKDTATHQIDPPLTTDAKKRLS